MKKFRIQKNVWWCKKFKSKKFWVRKNFGPKNVWVRKNFDPPKNFGPKNFGPKNFALKKIRIHKMFGPKFIRYCFKTLFGPKKLPSQLVQSKSLYVLQKICEGMDPTNYDTVLPKLRWRVGGWLGGSFQKIIPLRGPTCKSCKNPNKLDSKLGRVWQ